jgi:hypothetical protein
MTKNKINEINSAVEEVMSSDISYESIFELGVELGKYLTVSGKNYERLEFFTRKENEKDKGVRIKEKIKNISDLISNFIYWACLKQIEINGSIKFEASEYRRSTLNSLDAEIANQFNVNCKSVTQEDEGSEFDIEFEVIGKIAEIFEKYEVQKTIMISVENIHSTSKLVITNTVQLREVLGASPMFFNRNSAIYEEVKLDDYVNELNKSTLLTKIKNSES